jgi:methionyl-tRNA formyltransferase
MRVMFFGTAAFAVPSLERLAASHHRVVLCVTQPDRPQGRGLKLSLSPVKEAAQRLELAIAQPQRLTAGVVEGVEADVGVVAAYGQLLRPEVLKRPRHGILGVHPSLLPKYRGAAPVAWALLNGETRTGVTIFQLDERLDAGPIVLRCEVTVEPDEDAQRLTERLAHLGAEELLRALTLLESGQATPTPQDESCASVAPKLTKAQGRIDWRQPAEQIQRLARATSPWPGASTVWHSQPLKIVAAAVEPTEPVASGRLPGTVTGVSSDGIDVATGSGVLRIRELQPAGRKRMTAAEFLAGHRINVGDRFGTRDMGQET